MRVVITGGAGQVGSHIAELLVARGDRVACIDNFRTGRDIHVVESQSLNLIHGDISDPSVFSNPFGDNSPADVIVHTAASYADGEDWEEDSKTNIIGTINTLRYAQKSDARLIYFQTALCYGVAPDAQPVPLTYPRLPAPTSYAISKTAGEFYIEQSGIDFVTFRLANIVGPRNLSGALPIFFKRLSTGQKCVIADSRRDFVDVRDLSAVVIQAIDGAGHGAYHFSSGEDLSIHDLFVQVSIALGLKKTPEYDVPKSLGSSPKTILLDPSKTLSEFNVPELTKFEVTIRDAVAYYLKYGVDQEITHLKVK
jgi:nucleoside-diphosphate-sugar epimerase